MERTGGPPQDGGPPVCHLYHSFRSGIPCDVHAALDDVHGLVEDRLVDFDPELGGDVEVDVVLEVAQVGDADLAGILAVEDTLDELARQEARLVVVAMKTSVSKAEVVSALKMGTPALRQISAMELIAETTVLSFAT